MKKIHSTMMMLAIMVAALSLTACGGDDENEVWGMDMKYNQIPGYEATITFDDSNPQKITSPYMAMHIFSKYNKQFSILVNIGQTLLIDVSEMPHLNADLTEYITEFNILQLALGEIGGWEYVAGSAKVIMNDEEYITISFNNYQILYTFYNVFGEEKEHKLTIHGNIKFLIEC